MANIGVTAQGPIAENDIAKMTSLHAEPVQEFALPTLIVSYSPSHLRLEAKIIKPTVDTYFCLQLLPLSEPDWCWKCFH